MQQKNVYTVFRYDPPSVGFAQLSAAAGGSLTPQESKSQRDHDNSKSFLCFLFVKDLRLTVFDPDFASEEMPVSVIWSFTAAVGMIVLRLVT